MNVVKKLRESLPYLEQFHNEIFVVKVSGKQASSESSCLEDILLLKRIGIRVVLVHGIHSTLQEYFQSINYEIYYADHDMLIPDTYSETIQQIMSSLNWKFLTQMSSYKSQISAFSGHFMTAKPLSISHHENYCSGIIDQIAIHFHELKLSLPIFSPCGIGPKGRFFVLNANDLALQLACQFRAKKLIIITEENDLLNEMPSQDTQISHLQKKVNSDTLSLSSKHQIQTLIQASQSGIERCHLLHSSQNGGILQEVLTSTGAGIMVTNSIYRHIRSAKLKDIRCIEELLNKPTQEGVIVKKEQSYVSKYIHQFLVFCIDNEIIGCCEMVPFEKENCAELASLSVQSYYRNQGVAHSLVQETLKIARENQMNMIFALTQNAKNLFLKNHFKLISSKQLPVEKQQNYDSEESQIYAHFF